MIVFMQIYVCVVNINENKISDYESIHHTNQLLIP
jgi:hypothetical protein